MKRLREIEKLEKLGSSQVGRVTPATSAYEFTTPNTKKNGGYNPPYIFSTLFFESRCVGDEALAMTLRDSALCPANRIILSLPPATNRDEPLGTGIAGSRSDIGLQANTST